MTDAPAAPRAARARRFPPDQERTLLFDAAMIVLRRNRYTDAPIAEILEEAGLSTRSFYRHFESKDQLLLALYRRDAESAARRLRRRVAAEPTPAAGLRAFVEELFSFRVDRRRAERVAVLSSESVRRAEGWDAEAERGWELLEEPLVAVLEAGRADGTFPAADPARDAPLIRAMVAARAGLHSGSPTPDAVGATVDHLVAFCLRALGAVAD